MIQGRYSYPRIYTVTFCVSLVLNLPSSGVYTDYQEWLFNEIRYLKENFLTPIGYRKISQILNEKGIKSPTGKSFTNTMVFGIYNKGMKRLERINREDKFEVFDFDLKIYQ